jgi:hypothetical protein
MDGIVLENTTCVRNIFFSSVSVLRVTLEMRVETLVPLSCKWCIIDANSNWNISTSHVTAPNAILYEHLLNDSGSS